MRLRPFRPSGPRASSVEGEARAPARDWFVVAPAFVVPGVASLLLVPVLFTTLGADEYGRWILIYGVAAGVPQLTSTWLEAVTVRFAHRQTIDPRLTALALALSIALASVAAVLFVPGLGLHGVVATAVYTATIASYVLVIARLQSRQRFASLASTAVLRSILTATLATAGAVIGQSAPAVAIGSAAGLLLGIAMAWGLERRHGRPVDERADGRNEAEIADNDQRALSRTREGPPKLSASFASSSMVIAVAVFALSVGDRFILAAARPLGEVGLYAATYSIADLAGRLLPAILLVVLRPRLYRAWDGGATSWVHGQVADAALVIGWLGAATGLALLVMGDVGGFLPVSRDLVGPISIGLTALFVANAYGLVYTAAGWQGKLAARIALTALISILANVAIAPRYGAEGVAFVTLAAYVIQMLMTALGSPPGRSRFSGKSAWLVMSLFAIGLAVAAASWTDAPPRALAVIALGLTALARPIVRAVRRIGGASSSLSNRVLPGR